MEERVAVDWKKLQKMVEELKEKDLDEEEEKWYGELEGLLLYKNLKLLRKLYDKRIKVCE